MEILTLANAKSINDTHLCEDETLDLSNYAVANLEALVFLSEQGRWQFLDFGLRQMDTRQAMLLVEWGYSLSFRNLEYLSCEVAAILATTTGSLSLEIVHKHEQGALRELAKIDADLYLKLEGGLTLDVAQQLVNHGRQLMIRVSQRPALSSIRVLLENHSGDKVTLFYPCCDGQVDLDPPVISVKKDVRFRMNFRLDGSVEQEVIAIFDKEGWQDHWAQLSGQ